MPCSDGSVNRREATAEQTVLPRFNRQNGYHEGQNCAPKAVNGVQSSSVAPLNTGLNRPQSATERPY